MRAAVLLAALLAATPALAAPHWNVDAGKSKLGFTVQWAGQPFRATFKSWKANIAFDPADLAHSMADVTIDVASLGSGDDEMDDGVKGAQGFQASQFATARFTTTSIAHKSGNDYVAAAKLTIRGQTKPVTLPFTLTIDGNTAHMKGQATVSRMDFGIGQGGDFSKPAPVAYQVAIGVDVTATRAP
ncbi:MAG TPA: YceI family protein [Rhizomicrobium sp.]|nr:YceI family protein [Rhizomicrobium sp.]